MGPCNRWGKYSWQELVVGHLAVGGGCPGVGWWVDGELAVAVDGWQGYVQHAGEGDCQVGPAGQVGLQGRPGPPVVEEPVVLPQGCGPGGFDVEVPAWLRLPNLPLPLQVETKKV